MAFYSRDGFSCSCNIKNKCDGCNVKYIMPTKGDQIRTMSDEELADWIVAIIAQETIYSARKVPTPDYAIEMRQRWLEWLRQECER